MVRREKSSPSPLGSITPSSGGSVVCRTPDYTPARIYTPSPPRRKRRSGPLPVKRKLFFPRRTRTVRRLVERYTPA